MPHTFSRILGASLDLILPPSCAACQDPLPESDATFCAPCEATLLANPAPCPRCARPATAGRLCGECLRDPPPFVAATSPLIYGGQLAVAIGRAKYRGASEACVALGRLLRRLDTPSALDPIDLVVPVPLHGSRLRERGFNQSALLAAELVRGRRIPLRAAALCRLTPAPPQVALDAEGRARSVSRAFRAKAREVEGREVLLVDDVLTTGATAAACSEALLEAGARAVHLRVLARRA